MNLPAMIETLARDIHRIPLIDELKAYRNTPCEEEAEERLYRILERLSDTIPDKPMERGNNG